jgi:hypothetical protein
MVGSLLDEAYERLRRSGPEWEGWLSNHAPMAAEALVRHGHADRLHRWLDSYADRLEERPRGRWPIPPEQWREPLGDPLRTGDWLDFFARELTKQPWRDVLVRWWPRLLPGIAAGATHGVIRVGHAVRALCDDDTGPRVSELGDALGYWAARWQPLAPPGAGPYRAADPRAALDAVPRIPDQRHGIRTRLAQLADLPRWPETASAVPGRSGQDVPTRLAAIVDAAVIRFGAYGYASPIMMVHAATAPNAVLRVLPLLPRRLWEPSLAAAWAATAAITSAYAPAAARPLPEHTSVREPDAVLHMAADSGDEHAIKFADTAADSFHRTGDPAVVATATLAVAQIAAG